MKKNFRPSAPIEYVLSDVTPYWRKAVRQANDFIMIFSPYITSFSVLKNAKIESCDVFTTFSAETFASGASSLSVIKKMVADGFRVYAVENLHAKLVIARSCIATIGSQNLTERGKHNLEATAFIYNLDKIESIGAAALELADDKKQINMDLIIDMERQIRQLRREFAAIRARADSIDKLVWDAEAERQATKARQEAQRKAEASHQEKIDWARAHVAGLFDENGRLKLEIAERIIRSCAYWYDHPSGRPASAPNHSKRIKRGSEDWEIDFGANYFMIEKAVGMATYHIGKFIDKSTYKEVGDIEGLKKQIMKDATWHVRHQSGREYHRYTRIEKDHMKFGTQSIGLEEFAECVVSVGGMVAFSRFGCL